MSARFRVQRSTVKVPMRRLVDPGLTVASENDGTAFTDVGRAASEFATVPLNGNPITAVRVGMPPGLQGGLREVSVWAARPPLRSPSGTTALDALRDTFSGRTAGAARRGAFIAVAVAQLAAILLATGFVIGRRAPAAR